MSKLFLQLIKSLVAAMTAIATPAQVKEVLDNAFDAVEEKVIASSTQWDDVIVLPMLKALRAALDIPDNDQPEAETNAEEAVAETTT